MVRKKYLKGLNLGFIILIISFIISIFLRTFLSIKFGVMSITYDELLYWKAGQSISNTGLLSFRGASLALKEFVYPLYLAMIQDIGGSKAYVLMQVMNAILMSSAIFPAYFLGGKLNNRTSIQILFALYCISIPEMFYSSKILQENIFYPVFLWLVYYFLNVIEFKYSLKKILPFLIVINILPYIKQIGICFVVTVSIFYLFEILRQKGKTRIYAISFFALTIIAFFIVQIIINTILNISLIDNFGEQSMGAIGSNIIRQLLNLDILTNTCFTMVLYIVWSILFLGVYPPFILLFNYKTLSDKTKYLLQFILIFLLVSIFVICILIVPGDGEMGERNIRFHYRYLFYVFPLLGLCFFSNLKKLVFRKVIIIPATLFAVYFMLVRPIIIFGSEIDCIPYFSLQYFFGEYQCRLRLIITIVLYLVVSIIIMRYKRIAIYSMLFCTILCGINIFSAYKVYVLSGNLKNIYQVKEEDARKIEEYIGNSQSKVLLVGNTNLSSGTFEIYLDHSYYFCLYDDFIEYIHKYDMTKADFSGLTLFTREKISLTNESYDYIISESPVVFSCGVNIDIGLNSVYLYRVNAK